MAKDDTNPNSASDETVTAKPAVDAESPETISTSDEQRTRRGAPHLRVVGEDEDFVPAVAADAPHQRIGAVMKATRENLGLSLEQVSRETRVHLSHLRAIEDMTPNLLGAPVYAKGYIRAYARHLGLDEMGTLERYLRECAILKDPEKQDIAPPATGRNLPTAVPVLGFLVLALAGVAGAYFLANGKQPEAASAGSIAEASPNVALPAPGILADPVTDVSPSAPTLRIVAVKPAHLEVRSSAGDKFVDRDFLPGASFQPRVGMGWTVSTPDGSAFEWRLGDQSLGLLKVEGGPVYSQSVDLAAQRQPVVVAPPPVVESAPAPADTTPTTPAAASSTNAPSTSAPATTTAPPPKPKPATPPRPRQQAPATSPAEAPATPPVTAAAPPVQAPTTPARDPALAAYPDQ